MRTLKNSTPPPAVGSDPNDSPLMTNNHYISKRLMTRTWRVIRKCSTEHVAGLAVHHGRLQTTLNHSRNMYANDHSLTTLRFAPKPAGTTHCSTVAVRRVVEVHALGPMNTERGAPSPTEPKSKPVTFTRPPPSVHSSHDTTETLQWFNALVQNKSQAIRSKDRCGIAERLRCNGGGLTERCSNLLASTGALQHTSAGKQSATLNQVAQRRQLGWR